MLSYDKTCIRIDRDIQRLRNNPFPKNVEKLRGGNRHRIREGKYRMFYEINQKNKIIIIYRIKLRKTAYDYIMAGGGADIEPVGCFAMVGF